MSHIVKERHTFTWRPSQLITLVAFALITGHGGDAWAFPSQPSFRRRIAQALVADEVRQPNYDDFLRIIFANITPPTQLGGPNAYRVFFGATAYYEPPVTITQFANFSGIPVNSTVPLFAMRCIPPNGSSADPALATWPNLITRMLGDCEANPPVANSVDEAIQTVAESFADSSSQILTEPLASVLSFSEQFFQDYTPLGFTAAQMQAQMSRRFGAFTSFIGLGYAAEGTANSPSWDSAQVMQSLASPDFLLKNVTLDNAGCRCIEALPTVVNRDQLKLNPDFIWKAGGKGRCTEANLWAEDNPR
jgi:hypothetical protein